MVSNHHTTLPFRHPSQLTPILHSLHRSILANLFTVIDSSHGVIYDLHIFVFWKINDGSITYKSLALVIVAEWGTHNIFSFSEAKSRRKMMYRSQIDYRWSPDEYGMDVTKYRFFFSLFFSSAMTNTTRLINSTDCLHRQLISPLNRIYDFFAGPFDCSSTESSLIPSHTWCLPSSSKSSSSSASVS